MFGLGAVFLFIRLRSWLIWGKGSSSRRFVYGKTSGNSEKKSWVSEIVIAENLALFPFLQGRVIGFLANEMIESPQMIIVLWMIRYGITRNMS